MMKNYFKTISIMIALLFASVSYAQYCTPNVPAPGPAEGFINNFMLNSGAVLDHASTSMGYENITDTDVTIIANTNYRFDVGVGNPTASSHKSVDIWIDMDRDGIFDGANDYHFAWNGANTGSNLGFSNKNIGPVTVEGETRMRVAMRTANANITDPRSPCDDFTGGEVKDYKVNIYLSQPPAYCEPNVPVSTTSFINNFKLSNVGSSDGAFIDHASTNVGYENITSTEPTLTSGAAYGFNVGVGDPGLTSRKRLQVWVDLNRDGDFDDNLELAFSYEGNNTNPDLGFSNKPIGPIVEGGISRMRVAMVASDAAIGAFGPCDAFTGGEVKDYRVILEAPAPPAYCEPTIPMTASSFINNFKITETTDGDILNRASTNIGYENITDANITLVSNTTYAFNVGVGDPTLSSNKAVYVWIDLNGDLDFDDAGERVVNYSGANTNPDLNFTNKNIGPVLLEGESRMRVAMLAANSSISAINPCDDFTGGEVQDYTVNLLLTAPPTYCTPNVPITASSYINNFKLSNALTTDGAYIDHASTNAGYEKISNTAPTLVSGTGYGFNIGVGDPTLASHKAVFVWIDLNKDGDFEDAGEEIFNYTGANTNPDLDFSDKPIGPVTEAGLTTMRVAMVASNSEITSPIAPCDAFTGGEVEDYFVNVEPAPDCSSPTPVASTTSFLDYFKMTDVTDGDILNHTSGNDGYENITDSDAPLVAEKTYRLNFGVGNPTAGTNKRVHIWIDKNQDGDFEDAGEDIFSWSGTNTSDDLQFTNKTIGPFTVLGNTTMRVAMRSSNTAIPAMGPCDVFTDGEIEDYSVIVSAAIPPLTELTPEVDIDLFVGDQVPFSNNGTPHTYRIPSLVTSTAGTLLAITDIRYEDASDVPGVIDMAVRRSTDNGDTWGSPITIQTNHGGDACTVVDKTTGRIFIFYAYSTNQGIFGSNGDPNSPDTLRSRYVYSDDDGLTWSPHVDLTAALYQPGDKSYWASAGTGIQLRNGTLVIPIGVVRPGNFIYGALLYSTDHGETWNRSATNSFSSFDENTIVELNDGRIMVNSRNHYGTGRRLVTYTSDLGTTWEPYTFDTTLIDPICQGNILRYTSTEDGYTQNRILFSNPASTSERKDGALRISYDEGQTWTYSKLYQTGFSAYSSLAITADGKIGLLYESDNYTKIKFKRFSLDDLTDNNDTFVALNVEELAGANNGTKLFPNPVESILNITASQKSEVKIYNVVGKLVFDAEVSVERKEIDLSNLRNGLYFVKIKNELGISNFKIIKK